MGRLLDTIDSPADLKRVPAEQLPALCQELREEIVLTCARNGGHLGSSLGAVEINVALHRVFSSPEDRLVWDVGHQAYAHKLLTGRREAFRRESRHGKCRWSFRHRQTAPARHRSPSRPCRRLTVDS